MKSKIFMGSISSLDDICAIESITKIPNFKREDLNEDENNFYENTSGIKFIIKKITPIHYDVYLVINAEKDNVDRRFYGIDLDTELEKITLCKWLRANGYYYESSGCYNRYHLEIKCSENEVKIINQKLDTIA